MGRKLCVLILALGLLVGCSSSSSTRSGYDEVEVLIYERCLETWSSFAEERCADKKPALRVLPDGEYDPIELLEYKDCLAGYTNFYEEWCDEEGRPTRY